jgi:hypothetical protein
LNLKSNKANCRLTTNKTKKNGNNQLTAAQRAKGEKGTTECAFATVKTPRKDCHVDGDIEKRALSVYESLQHRYLTCLKTGNKQGLFESIRELYQLRNRVRERTGGAAYRAIYSLKKCNALQQVEDWFSVAGCTVVL